MRNNLAIALLERLDESVCAPQEREESFQPRWTVKRLVAWLQEQYHFDCGRETCQNALKKLGFSWKKAKKLLNKANPAARKAFVDQLKPLLDLANQGQHLLVYLDEAHLSLDTDEGYGWSIKGQRFWVSSSSPGCRKVSFYGAYLYNQGEVRCYPGDKANGTHTIDILTRIRAEHPKTPMTLTWDGASYHRSAIVTQAAEQLQIQIQRLPSYRPDFMPVEHLWQWLREEVTYHTCYNHQQQLIAQVKAFQQFVNTQPHQVADRLWTTTSLDLGVERWRFST